MLIREDIEENRRLKFKIHTIIVKFGYKYIVKLFQKELSRHESKSNKPKLYTDFQRSLLKIPKWSEKTLQKQYNKFTKWLIRQTDLQERDLQNILTKIIKFSTQIILNKSDAYIDALLQDYNFPTLKDYYYRCLKRIARRIYENPKELLDINKSELIDDLENILQKVLPSTEIKTILEFVDEQNDKIDNIKIQYDFDNKSSSNSNSSISLRKSEPKRLIVDKQDSDNSLHYVSSDEIIQNDSDGGLSQILKDVSVQHNNIDEDTNVKHIRIPKFKKSQYYYNKPKVNEINEHFFNE
jgi:hypothetical protein